tara:strand:- start:511 stop:744 length:234 start_codon:yes stop_codon:yes gene_type:complete
LLAVVVVDPTQVVEVVAVVLDMAPQAYWHKLIQSLLGMVALEQSTIPVKEVLEEYHQPSAFNLLEEAGAAAVIQHKV